MSGMKPTLQRLKIALAFVALSAIFCGCSVITNDRVFPKLTWYWSKEAKAQRAERAQEKSWEQSLPTNSPAR